MAAVVSHALAATAIATVLRPEPKPTARYWAAAMTIAVVPDFDIAFVWMGARYRGMFGHRGITHSIAFAAIAAVLLAFSLFRDGPRVRRIRIAAVLFAAGLSHGILDASMASGVGVAFLAPFSSARYHLPFRPIRVTPPTGDPWLDPGGIRVTDSEILWIWLPALVVILAASRASRVDGRKPKTRDPAPE
ncbi:MAG TPA: metal-dependent hydrolase [Thermoanaerobaculia bacterium]|nr:metal-dependent hydrolase [Thermoanaerobaculia bacterium]